MKRTVLAILTWAMMLPAYPAAAPDVEVAYDKYSLRNGLDVILVEDHRLPLVTVNLWYHVGAANERPGRTGFAHLFEHMMFQGSKHVPPDEHFKRLEGAGASEINGSTNFDRTNYYETLPSNQLELALWLESDRMGFLLETLDQEMLTNQRDVVRNERRQSIENPPYGLVSEAVFHTLFPKGHPYYAFIMGSHADLEAARLPDVREFFKQYYAPNNASLVIVGDIDKLKTRALVEKYFGPLPAGPKVPKVDAKTPPITAERRVTVTDKVELPVVYMAWLTAPIYQPGDAEADLLATILGGGKSSRLYKRLVYEKQIAQDVSAYQQSMRLTSVFTIEATAKPGVKPEQLEQAIDEELAKLRAEGPQAAELERARNSIESALIQGAESLNGTAERLNTYNHYVGDPGYFATDLGRYGKVAPAGVKQAAAVLSKSSRVVIYGVPGEKVVEDVPKTVDEGKAAAVIDKPAVTTDDAWRNRPPVAGPPSKLALPVPQRFQLANGLWVYLVEQHSLPIVSANLVVLSGRDINPADRPGLASFTADLLDEGTQRRSALQIADDMAQIGASIGIGSGTDSSTVTARTLKSNVDATFDLMADITLHPAFKQDEIERVRHDRLTQLLQQHDSANAIASMTFTKTLYGSKHPYGYVDLGTEKSLRAMSRDEVLAFWKASYTPDNAALVVGGDITVDELKKLADKHFGQWQGKATSRLLPVTQTADARKIVVVDKGKSPQTALFIGQVGVSRANVDVVPLEVLNTALGGMFSSRINMNLREKNGYTYGASSQFSFRRGPGPFLVMTGVRTDATAPAITEIFSELSRIRSENLQPQELALAKDSFSRSLPGLFDTSFTAVASVGQLFIHGLPLDYYSTLPAKIDAVNAAEVRRVAEQYLKPERMIIVAVGDRSAIEPGLKKLDLGPVEIGTVD